MLLPRGMTSYLISAKRTINCVKKRAYKQRVRMVEHASFTPVVLAATGGMANKPTYFTKDWHHSLQENGTGLQFHYVLATLLTVLFLVIFHHSMYLGH